MLQFDGYLHTGQLPFVVFAKIYVVGMHVDKIERSPICLSSSNQYVPNKVVQNEVPKSRRQLSLKYLGVDKHTCSPSSAL